MYLSPSVARGLHEVLVSPEPGDSGAGLCFVDDWPVVDPADVDRFQPELIEAAPENDD